MCNFIVQTAVCLPAGGKPRVDWGTVPPKFEIGTAHAFVPPNILRSSVVRCARKYERVKKGVFLVRKGSCTTFIRAKIRKTREKRGKIRRTWSMTKKRSSEIFCAKMGIFLKKSSSWSSKTFPYPQTRRQVSAHGRCGRSLVRLHL